MSAVIMAAVLAGFAPTFYLRAFFDVPPIPTYLYVHGAILTSWFALCVVQTFLVTLGRSDLHRRFGWFGAALAVLVVIAGAVALVGSVQRSLAQGGDIESLSYFAWLVIGGLVIFAVFVAGAVRFRRRSETHKRLMLFASINITGAALTRIFNWPVFDVGTPLAFVRIAENNYNAAELLMIFALVLHDLVSRKRLHATTIVGVALSVLSVVIPAMIAQTEIGRMMILAIS
jgi:hypothetical protein